MSDMHLLAAAKSLMSHPPLTLADARALEALEEEAVGEEGLCIARRAMRHRPRAGGRGSQTLSPGGWLSGFRVGGQQ